MRNLQMNSFLALVLLASGVCAGRQPVSAKSAVRTSAAMYNQGYTEPVNRYGLLGDFAEVQSAIDNGLALPPAQAAQSLQSFWNAPELPVNAIGFWNEGQASPYGFHYHMRVPTGQYAGLYMVRATDGALSGMSLKTPPIAEETPPVIDVTGARQVATQFAQEHYPGFATTQWAVTSDEDANGNDAYQFIWTPLIGNSGARAPWGLFVDVDKYSGSVNFFSRPYDQPVNCPTDPQISMAQAIQIATPFAFWNPAQVPFSEAQLQIGVDAVGINQLEWNVFQYEDGTHQGAHFQVDIDAMTGEVMGFSAPLGQPLVNRQNRVAMLRRRQAQESKKTVPLRLRSSDGPEVYSLCKPRLENGQVWVRAELLRGFRAWVTASPDHLVIRDQKRSVNETTAGAKWRDGGWWVPLRATAAELGWPVYWAAGKREVVVRQSIRMPRRA